jgi:DNA-binding CsgD family transcriptional regulator
MLSVASADVGRVIALAHDLAAIPDLSQLLNATVVGVREILRADSTGINIIDLESRTIHVPAVTPVEIFSCYDDLPGLLAELAAEHPMVQHYQRPGDWLPRRVSDVCEARAWFSCRTYAEIFVPRRTRWQLTVPIGVGDGRPVRGVALTADRGTDFDDRELGLAHLLQPVLTALDRTSRPGQSAKTCDPVAARHRAALTVREHEVLVLLSQGLTASAIARRTGARPATIRKHLQRIYFKLGEHDRLTAVGLARHLGLLPEPDDHHRQATGHPRS